MRNYRTLALLASCTLPLFGCGAGSGSSGAPQGLLLAQSHRAGKEAAPARLVIVRPPTAEGESWTSELVDEGDGTQKVFHKALWYTPPTGDPGILTISATSANDVENPAFIKLWRKQGEAYSSETLWEGQVGLTLNRLRDVEVGDVDGDGQDELVIVTHDGGSTMVFEHTSEGLVPEVLSRSEVPEFIHEAEIGDVDGDGLPEFFCTPSEPNQSGGAEATDDHQTGRIEMFRKGAAGYERSVVEGFEKGHAKEILTYDWDKSGKEWLFTAVEFAKIGDAGKIPAMLRAYQWKDGAMVGEDLIEIPGNLCRFLAAGDTDGDGKPEIIAATFKSGIFAFDQFNGTWRKRQVALPYLSSSFEHAIYLFDWDGDGRDDIFVASDQQGYLRRFYFDDAKGTWRNEKLVRIAGDVLMTWNIMPLPGGE